MKYNLLSILIFFSFYFSSAQEKEKWLFDSSHAVISKYEENKDGTVYTGMYEILKGIQPISYVSLFANYFAPIYRPIPLMEGEGKNGYLLEGNIDQSFTLIQGRNQSNHNRQRWRLAFRYAPLLRMTLDSSLPIVPINQKVGLELDWAAWNNYTKKTVIRKSKLAYANDETWHDTKNTFKVLHIVFYANHYSNGQAPGVYYQRVPFKRNDYRKGDFSTNFLSLMAVYSAYHFDNSLFSIGAGVRIDGGLGDIIAYNPEQEQRFGRFRFLQMLQLRTSPKPIGRIKPWRDLNTGETYGVRNKINYRFRVENEIIAGDMSNFDSNKKYRLGTHFYWEVELANSRTTGFILHLYQGRDYVNIRYDDVVVGGNVGLTFTLTKYHPPRMPSSSFIVSKRKIGNDKLNKKFIFKD